ncbi:CvpA family protein [Novosphingobium sp.]|uniref:CvpA family protein n=1 Tax=Novosphingobium sp. TaxID=1874826 RepID=UPI00334036DF
MSGFDYVVFLVVGLAAIGGFFRGFVEEVVSLLGWCLRLLAVHYGHAPLTAVLTPTIGNETGAGVLAFGILLVVPWFVTRMLARNMGQASRGSLLGPIDRVLGFGFGAIKGFVIMVLAFALLVFAYDMVWGVKGRPAWLKDGRTYPFLNAASDELMTMVGQRRSDALHGTHRGAGDTVDDSAATGDDPAPRPSHRAHRHRPPPSDPAE